MKAPALTDRDVLELAPVSVRRENGHWIFGVPGNRRYYATSEEGARAIQLLASKLTIGQVRNAMGAEMGGAVELCSLLEALVATGAVQAVNGRRLDSADSGGKSIAARVLELHCFRILLSLPASGVYLSFCLIAVTLLAIHGWPFLPLDALLRGSFLSSAPWCLGIAVAGILRHEWAHGIACQSLGVTPRFRLSTRFLFPVMETDMTDLWSIGPHRRWVAYVAGMVSDLLTFCLLVIVATGLRQWHVAHPMLLWLVSMGAITTAGQLLWECNAYLRTDVYYLIGWAMGCRRLHYDAAHYLRTVLPLARRRSSPREYPLGVRCYAWYMIVGYIASSFFIAAILLASARTLALAIAGKGVSSPAIEAASSALGLLTVNFLVTLLLRFIQKRKSGPGTVVEAV